MKKQIKTFTELRKMIENEQITVDFLREWRDFIAWDYNFWDLWALISREQECVANLDVIREFQDYLNFPELFFCNFYLFNKYKDVRDEAIKEFWEEKIERRNEYGLV